MKTDFVVYIGDDRRTPENTVACHNSLRASGYEGDIVVLQQQPLIDDAIYWRQDQGSTEFAFTRFLVPYLKGFYGKALFCDSDFIWRCNPEELLKFTQNTIHPVWCTQHNLMPDDLSDTKKNGAAQRWYPRKNWASLMLFDCDHPDMQRLMPTSVSEEAASWLFGLSWASSVGKLPIEYNCLVGYKGYDATAAKALHFTDGTPSEVTTINAPDELVKEYRQYLYAPREI